MQTESLAERIGTHEGCGHPPALVQRFRERAPGGGVQPIDPVVANGVGHGRQSGENRRVGRQGDRCRRPTFRSEEAAAGEPVHDRGPGLDVPDTPPAIPAERVDRNQKPIRPWRGRRPGASEADPDGKEQGGTKEGSRNGASHPFLGRTGRFSD